jgi:Protein of unknown function (DUF2752)
LACWEGFSAYLPVKFMEAISAQFIYSSRDRIQYFALIGVATTVLGIARVLHPAEKGVGTHQQLGLPPCFFLSFTGIPCPACGLTTSFAQTVRFNFREAFFTQPFGLIACIATALLIPLSFYLMKRRVAWMSFITARGSNAVMYLTIVLMLLGWIYKINLMR